MSISPNDKVTIDIAELDKQLIRRFSRQWYNAALTVVHFIAVKQQRIQQY